jgi:hypothetical protein
LVGGPAGDFWRRATLSDQSSLEHVKLRWLQESKIPEEVFQGLFENLYSNFFGYKLDPLFHNHYNDAQIFEFDAERLLGLLHL